MFLAAKNKTIQRLPEQFDIAHKLCFTIHDILLQALESGDKAEIFKHTIAFDSEIGKRELDNSEDIFTWLENENRLEDRAKILKTTVLPAVLSDMLHCIYEALKTSEKAKLSVSYMLIRKPIQESLYLLESLVLDELNFAELMANDPLKLRPKNAGSVIAHQNRIEKVLKIINSSPCLNASYIAQLRYDKSSDDSFDGICNLAMHLFTENRYIKTEQLNINFIFSGWNQKLSQWSYLYSRLPYLLLYIHKVVEYLIQSIVPTSQMYLDEMHRRISALIILWGCTIKKSYKEAAALETLFLDTETWINKHCQKSGYRVPNHKDLQRMAETGEYPNESLLSRGKRKIAYKIQVKFNNTTAKY